MDVTSINPGQNFIDALTNRLSTCKAIIVVIHPTWATSTSSSGQVRLLEKSDVVRLEIEQAIVRKVPIFPVLVDNATMPERDRLPESIRPIGDLHALEIGNDNFDLDTDRLIGAINRTTGIRKWSSRKRMRQASVALALVTATIMVGLIAVYRKSGTDQEQAAADSTFVQQCLTAVPLPSGLASQGRYAWAFATTFQDSDPATTTAS
jgi:hypothetical protein